MSEENDDEKSHDPSERRLADARKRGEIPRSTDLTAAASYAGLLLALMIFGQAILQKAGQAGQLFLEKPEVLAALMIESAKAPLGAAFGAFAGALAPMLLLPAIFVLLALIGQQAFVFVPSKLAPKMSRVSPLSIAGQKFGREGLFEFGKSFVKMLAVGVILGIQLLHRFPEIVASMSLPPAQGIKAMLAIMVDFLFLVALLTAAIGGLDYFWQRAQHLRRNRMSYKDMIDEMKDSEGDPHFKAQRRQRGQEIAMNQMLRDVATADVVIVNPTHYAVALKWKRSDRTAPVCVAKGVDDIAARIREKAAIAGVPLHSDPPTARALHASVEIGRQILPEHYKPVAAAIRFAETLRKRSKTLR